MAVTFTTNKGYTAVTVGTESGTWGPYVNGNMSVLDNNMGGVATVALTNSPVTLSSGQYSCAFVRFTGAITANVTVTFPAVGSFYSIINDTTNSSAFIVIAAVSGGVQSIGVPNGVTDILTDGTNARFRSFAPVGSYLTVARSSTPSWITTCTVPPYLNCDGGAFSAVTYPALSAYLGGTTLPDTRGRVLAALNQGTGRLNAVNGDTFLAGSISDQVTIQQTHIPNYALSVSDPGHVHGLHSAASFTVVGGAGPIVPSLPFAGGNPAGAGTTDQGNTGITVNSNGGGVALPVIQPTLVAGITLIRAV